MVVILSNTVHSISKRGLWNIGGHENHQKVHGNENQINIGVEPSRVGQETLLRKAGHQLGRVLEGGSDLLVAPAKWINHMQSNW